MARWLGRGDIKRLTETPLTPEELRRRQMEYPHIDTSLPSPPPSPEQLERRAIAAAGKAAIEALGLNPRTMDPATIRELIMERLGSS